MKDGLDVEAELLAFVAAWQSGDDERVQATAKALILASGEAVPEVDPCLNCRPDDRHLIGRIRHEGAIRGAALGIHDHVRYGR